MKYFQVQGLKTLVKAATKEDAINYIENAIKNKLPRDIEVYEVSRDYALVKFVQNQCELEIDFEVDELLKTFNRDNFKFVSIQLL